MKTIRMNKQRLRLINKWLLQRNQEVAHPKWPTVQEEYWLHSVINAIQDGITVMDTNYNIILQNDTTSRMHNDRDIMGQPCYMVHYGRNEPCDNCHTVEAMKTGQLVKKDKPYHEEGPSGQTFEVYAYPITDGQGFTTGVVEYLRDITELKKREHALQDSESRYAQLYRQKKEKELESSLLISQMQLGLALHEVICDETGNPVDYRFLSVNDSYERLTGLHREDLIGNTVLKVLPNTEAYWIQTYGNVALTGVARQFENYSVELDKYFHVNVYSPQPNQFAVIVDDVTEKRKAALDLTQAKKQAEVANKAKTQFLANMSHELRTPLNGLMGMLQLLQSTSLSEEQQEYIHIALGGSQSLTRVVEDILNYTNIEKRAQNIIEEPFQLEGLLQEVAKLHQGAAVHKGLFLNVYKEKNLPEQLIGDRFKLKQILGNLVGNAVKFTENGIVQLSVKQAGGGEAADQRIQVCFQVKDTGIGIPPEKMDYIFQRFSQADESHTRQYGGLGLGLAVAKEQATMLCGNLTAESTPGQGSIFTLTCEVGVGQESKAAADPLEVGNVYFPEARFSGIHVLVTDDDYSSRLMAELHLKKMGCDVDTAINGQIALEKVAVNNYHLVFMDCQMPVMDGYEATQNIRKLEKRKGCHTPVIAMTAKVLPGDREKCMEAGMDGFLAKPFELDQLKSIVNKFANEESKGKTCM